MLQKIAKMARRESGFTLVELLIVVAIIAILAAIAIPQFTSYRKRGYVTAVNSDIKNAYTAAQAYLTDNPAATVDSLAKLQAGGYVQTNGVALVTNPNMTLAAGSIQLQYVGSVGLTSNVASVQFDGTMNAANQ